MGEPCICSSVCEIDWSNRDEIGDTSSAHGISPSDCETALLGRDESGDQDFW